MEALTTVEISKKFNIPRSTLYTFINSGAVSVPPKKSNRAIWTPELISSLRNFIDFRILSKKKEEKLPYRTTAINNRRYLGNKYKLISFIEDIVNKHCSDIESVADIFAGTGAVSSLFKDKKIITNDIMYSNYVCHLAWFGRDKVSQDKIIDIIQEYNLLEVKNDNYMSQNFANTYFNRDACRKIGFIREDIEKLYLKKSINARERAILITSLLYSMDRIANTCGHYDAYRKNGELDKKLEMVVPMVSNELNSNNKCYNTDANALVKNIEADLVYIDPPYNSRQYCDIYHLVENVARWQKPKVSGVAKKMERDALKSDYCTGKAAAAFEDLIKNIKTKYILLSYNNMADKGNSRSNAKISDEDIMRILSSKGKVSVFSTKYKAFSAGKSDIMENEERLFLCECHENQNKCIQSPLNYTGGKFKLLSQILPHFPQRIDTFVDLFCGGGNVGINVNAKNVIFNDKEPHLLYIYNTFKNLEKDVLLDMIHKLNYFIMLG